MRSIQIDTISQKFLWRALPLSALLMAMIWVAAALFVEWTIRAEGKRIVARAASDRVAQIRSHITAVIESARIASRNELLVSSLLDPDSRAFVLAAFMRSLRLPGIGEAAGFVLLDYSGGLIADAGPLIAAGQRHLPLPGDGESIVLSADWLRAVFPIRYGGATEGYFLVHIPTTAMLIVLVSDASQLGETTIRLGEAILHDGCCTTDSAPTIRSARLPVEGFPGLTVELLIDRSTLFPVIFQLNWFLLGAFGADILVLLGVSLFAAAAVVRPLHRMVGDIRLVSRPEALRLEGYERAPREIRFLASAFNSAAGEIAVEIRQRQKALREAEANAAHNALLAAVIEHSSNGITISDARAPGQPFVYANPAFFRITGYQPADVIGRHRDFLNERAPNQEAVAHLREAVAAGRDIRLEMSDVRKDGSEYWNQLSLYAVHDADGTVSHIIGVQIDVTEQRRARDTMAQTAHLTSLGEMATGLAHELNQPLNVIRLAALNLAAQLEGGPALPASVAHKLDRIQKNVTRAGTIIEHMKIFGRGDSGPPAPFRLRDALDGALQIIGSELRSFGIEVRRRAEADDLFACGKPLAIEQVAINLALNARDAIVARRAGGGPAENDWIEFEIAARGGMAVLSVEDTGGGIPEAIQAQIFAPFFTTKPVGKGSGLGLSVSFGIAADLGGTLTVGNTARGAKFELCLPLATRNAPPASTTPASEPAS